MLSALTRWTTESGLTRINHYFCYPCFRDATTQIRLLQVLVSSDSDDIQIRMEVYDLKSVHRGFVAISYAWGDSKDLVLVSVNQQKFAITRNGAEALRRAFRYDASRLYWIDVISIDQRNKNEKQSQIQIMGKIFSSALYVAANVTSEPCLRTLEEAVETNNYQSKELARDLCTFFGSPYFTRMWIVQEVLLALDLRWFCGEDVHSGWTIVSFLNPVMKHQMIWGKEIADSLRGSRAVTLMDDKYNIRPGENLLTGAHFAVTSIRPSSRWNPPKRLSAAILRYAGGNCANPLDKIYALVGLADYSGSTEGFPINYAIGEAELVTVLAMHLPGKCKTNEAARALRKIMVQFFSDGDSLSDLKDGARLELRDALIAAVGANVTKSIGFVHEFKIDWVRDNAEGYVPPWAHRFHVDLSMAKGGSGVEFPLLPYTIPGEKYLVALPDFLKRSKLDAKIWMHPLHLLDAVASTFLGQALTSGPDWPKLIGSSIHVDVTYPLSRAWIRVGDIFDFTPWWAPAEAATIEEDGTEEAAIEVAPTEQATIDLKTPNGLRPAKEVATDPSSATKNAEDAKVHGICH